MSDRENEFDNTGGNRPDVGGVDREAAEDAANNDASGRQDPAEAAAAGERAADAGSSEAPSEYVAPASGEPSHEAVGIGVIDDGSDHHGQDGTRDTLTVSESQQVMDGDQEQRLPAMSQNNASDVDKIAGIVAQTRQDVGTETQERISEVLRQRLRDAGISVPDDEVAELASQVSTGDAHSAG
jgi:hypothetical protein